MPMSEQEQIDLAKLKEDIAKERELFFSIARSIDDGDSDYLRAAGLSELDPQRRPLAVDDNKQRMQIWRDRAIAYHYRYYAKKIDKLTGAFIKKYPDEK